MIGLLVPYNSPGLNLANGTAASSPFVIAIKNSGIKALPSVRGFGCFLLPTPLPTGLIVI